MNNYNIAVAGTGYVGLVAAVAFAEIGHNVYCVDTDESKIKMMNNNISPIYENGLEELMIKNKARLAYSTNFKAAYSNADVIIIGVGTPEREDGSANLNYVFTVLDQIATSISRDCVVVIKSTVPIGTNDEAELYLKERAPKSFQIDVVSNPEFLAQGTAVRDTLYASRIVVGAESERAFSVMRQLYLPFTQEPYNVPYLEMNRRSAEMVKYASNDFLALKISYINEIANLCEEINANIEDVTKGMSLDSRIGDKFLNAGIGYGGSCFPKDTKALHWVSKSQDAELKTVKACIDVNESQKTRLFYKLLDLYNGNIHTLNVAILGATFKPGTDDLREAPSIENIKLLLSYGAKVCIYDPIGLERYKTIFADTITYVDSIDACIRGKDVVMIMTEWETIKNYALINYINLMKTPIIFDGRNCYGLDKFSNLPIYYHSIGRKIINNITCESCNNAMVVE